jgi:DNA-binding CsgD family transcriptional regulator
MRYGWPVTHARPTLDSDVYAALRIPDVGAVRGAAVLLRDVVRAITGLNVTASHDIASPRPMCDAEGEALASTVFRAASADRWWLRPQLALRSPLVAACRVMAEPFWCNAQGFYGHGRKPILPEIDLADFAERTRARVAIAVPVHLPFGQVGAASLLADDPACEDLQEPFDRGIDIAAIYIRRFVTAYVEVTQRPSRLAGSRLLTRREVECLRWAALGKTNDEIGTIVGLSRATVRFHIRNASQKLDAVNRDQTVFKATQLGYIPVSR